MIKLENIRFSYDGKSNQIEIASLELPESGIVLLYGDNGSGKTTLLKYLAGLLADGEGSQELAALRDECLYLHQNPYLLRGSVKRNLEFADKESGPEMLAAALEEVGLSGFEERNVRALSGGERKRVALARAIMSRRRVLLFDEPAAHLDIETRRLLEDLLPRLASENRLLIVTTHIREFGYRLSDQVRTIKRGRLENQDENIYSGKLILRNDGVHCFRSNGVDLIVPDVAGEFKTAVVPYRDVILTDEHPHSSARNILTGTVREISPSPAGTVIAVDCGLLIRARITDYSVDEMELQPGKVVNVMFKASSVALY